MCDEKNHQTNFYSCIFQSCFFHYYKAILKKIKKLNLFMNTLILEFKVKVYPSVNNEIREDYYEKIEKLL